MSLEARLLAGSAWSLSPIGYAHRARERLSLRVGRIRGVRLSVELLGRGYLEKRAAHLLGDDFIANVFTRFLGSRRGDEELFREVLRQVVLDLGWPCSGIGQESVGVVRTLGMLAHGPASKLIHDACHRAALVQRPRRIRPMKDDATAIS
jgi:hypothetical protein